MTHHYVSKQVVDLPPALLRYGLHCIADLKPGTRNWRAHGGDLIHVSQSNHADGRSHAANYGAGRWILNLFRHSLYGELIANFQASL